MLGVMAGVLYLTQQQQVQILGFNLFAIRFVELAGFIRVMSRQEFSFSRLNGIDRIFLLLYFYTTVVFLLRSRVDYGYQIGIAVDAFLCYFTFRGLIGGIEDFKWILRAFLFLLVPYVAVVLFESFTSHNLFSILGSEEITDALWSRNGRPRCVGSFRNPSLLGTLGATLLPLYLGLWFSKAYRKFASLGILLCLLIVWASNSGSPTNTAAIGVVGWLFWKARRQMRLLRRMLLFAIVSLALVMRAPIWYLPAKVSALSGGDGWHRSYLMDIAFQNIDQWWLAGMPMLDTQDWFPYVIGITGAADITNQYLSFGISAGVLAILLFFVLLIRVFKQLGTALALSRSSEHPSKESEYLIWGLGVMLVGHLFNWLGITYFDQSYVIWFMQLAAISTLSEFCIRSAQVGVPCEVDPESLTAGCRLRGTRNDAYACSIRQI